MGGCPAVDVFLPTSSCSLLGTWSGEYSWIDGFAFYCGVWLHWLPANSYRSIQDVQSTDLGHTTACADLSGRNSELRRSGMSRSSELSQPRKQRYSCIRGHEEPIWLCSVLDCRRDR